MYKAYKFRLYPDAEQEVLLAKTFGCARFIYNHFLDKCKRSKFQKAFDLVKEIPSLYTEYPWLKEVDSCSLRTAVFNLEDAYQNFFAKRSGYPKFKNRYNKQSYRTDCVRKSYKGKEYANIKLDLENRVIKLPKMNPMKIRGYRNLEVINGRIINATITKEKTGKYYVSVLFDEIETKKAKVVAQNIVGIDLGLKDLVITSDGERFDNPKEIRKYEKRIKRLQKELSRRIIGSNNREKTRRKLARTYEKLKNARKHNRITIVNELVSNHDIIVSEKLNVQGMVQNHHLAKSILDASFGRICTMLEYKCKSLGKYYYQVDTKFPSSKTCSRCGEKTSITNDLSVREWTCEVCGDHHDRDINASINIMFEGLKNHYAN